MNKLHCLVILVLVNLCHPLPRPAPDESVAQKICSTPFPQLSDGCRSGIPSKAGDVTKCALDRSKFWQDKVKEDGEKKDLKAVKYDSCCSSKDILSCNDKYKDAGCSDDDMTKIDQYSKDCAKQIAGSLATDCSGENLDNCPSSSSR